MTNSTYLPIDRIIVDPENNPRKGPLEGIPELAASIKANGLLQPVVVRMTMPEEGGALYELIAGYRRFAALQHLGKTDINCIITQADNVQELALTENVMRQAMHPVDEYETFARLKLEGLTLKKIAKHFGLTEKGVKQRLALGTLLPEWRDAWRDDVIGERAAQRLATATLDQQREILDHATQNGGLKKGSQIPEHWIVNHLRQDRVTPADKRLKFIGLDAYRAAGGKIEKDLFGQDEWLSDPELLDCLVADAQDKIEEEAKAEGWGTVTWDTPDWTNCYRVTGDNFEPEERAGIVCHLGMDWDGKPTRVLMRKAPELSAPPTTGPDRPGGTMMAEPDQSKALSWDMSLIQTGFAQVYAQRDGNHHTVLAMLAYVLTHPNQTLLPLRIRPELLYPVGLQQELIAEAWKDIDTTGPGSLEWLMGLETDDLVGIIRKWAARCFDFGDKTGIPTSIRKQWYRQLIANGWNEGDVEAEPPKAWRPTQENYFKRLTKAQIMDVIRKMLKLGPVEKAGWSGAGDVEALIKNNGWNTLNKEHLAHRAEMVATAVGWLPELLDPELYDDTPSAPSADDELTPVEDDIDYDPTPEDMREHEAATRELVDDIEPVAVTVDMVRKVVATHPPRDPSPLAEQLVREHLADTEIPAFLRRAAAE